MNSLKGKTILITRSRNQADSFRSALQDAGAKVIEIPTIAIVARQSPELDAAIHDLKSYDWLMFTSANGVEIFFERMRRLGSDPLPVPSVCAIGPATAAAVESTGNRVDLLPSLYQAEGILEEFLALHHGDIRNLRILLPRAAQARQILPETLRKMGAEVNVVAVYETVIPQESRARLKEVLEKRIPDLITFTSSSTVHNFVALARQNAALNQFHYAAIGPVTAETAREYGLEIAVQPKSFTIPDLVEAIREYFGKGGSMKAEDWGRA